MSPSSLKETGPTLLVVDDDAAIRALLADSLGRHGYRVETAATPHEMDALLVRLPVELIILDIMMPGEDGISVCRRIASGKGPPIILLSALGDEADRVLGLEIGASHYLPKPCSPREILATVRAALRQTEGARTDERQAFGFAGWRIDFVTRELFDATGVLIALTDGEFAVLRVFVERPRRILAREALLDAARGRDNEAYDRAIDVQVSRLRRKLRAPGDEIIRTVRNEGYFFVPRVVRV
ncbi:MAG: response regulator [Candidatus Sphingomonas phytovorans]|nr:response regulator [Sphingomonas sp.]WEK01161.1 MAG: response regulator [Sphingomonas sp.]